MLRAVLSRPLPRPILRLPSRIWFSQSPSRLANPAAEISDAAPVQATTKVHGRSLYHPYFHPQTHNLPVANIQFRSHHPRLLDLFTHFATHAASALGIPISRVVHLPVKRTLWTVPRSPFAHKKSQENFERRVHKRTIKAWDAGPEVVDRWCTYLRRHALGGVGMRVTKWERFPIGFGRSRPGIGTNQALRASSDSSNSTTQKIRALGDKIVLEELVGGSKRTSKNMQ